MNIVWKGQSFFEVQTETALISIDPFDEKETGLKLPKTEADILLSSKKVSFGNPFLINSAGEFEIKDVFIQGIQGLKDKEPILIYKIEAEGMKLLHVSELKQKELTEEQIEEIGDVDVLMIPVGGKDALDAKEAKNIISQIEPRIVIPMRYKIPNLQISLDGIEGFLKQMGAEKVVPEKRLKLNLRTLPTEETKIVVLEP